MRIKKVTEVIGTKVYTDSGDYFGEVEEVNLIDNKKRKNERVKG